MATWVGRSIVPILHASGTKVRLLRSKSLFEMALASVYLPHLVAYSGNLIQREHYQFFPVAWFGSLVLVWTRRNELEPRSNATMPAVGWLGLGLASLMLAAAGILNSSWLAMISVLPMALGMAWLTGGWHTARAFGPALLLFGTTIRLPGMLDAALIRRLRFVAVGLSSRILDVLGIIHVHSGNILRVAGEDLLVDEACSGVNSLVSIVAVVLFLGLFSRRRPIHLVLLLCWSVVIVLLANVARVSIVAVAFARWKVDLLHGWKHEALGIALYAVSLSLVMSMDHLILLFTSMIPRRSSSTSRYTDHLRDPARTRSSSAEAELPRHCSSESNRRRMIIFAATLAVIAVIDPTRWSFGVLTSRNEATINFETSVRRAKAALSEQSMPIELAGWRRIGFKAHERRRDDSFGLYSASWQYQLGSRSATVSIDYPFQGWHELIVCYEAIEWTAQQGPVQRGAIDAGSGPGPAFVAASLRHRDGGHASLRFGLADEKGRWITPPEKGLGLGGRATAWGAVAPRVAYQFQLFSTGFRARGEEEQQQDSRLFLLASREFKRVLSASGAIEP